MLCDNCTGTYQCSNSDPKTGQYDSSGSNHRIVHYFYTSAQSRARPDMDTFTKQTLMVNVCTIIHDAHFTNGSIGRYDRSR